MYVVNLFTVYSICIHLSEYTAGFGSCRYLLIAAAYHRARVRKHHYRRGRALGPIAPMALALGSRLQRCAASNLFANPLLFRREPALPVLWAGRCSGCTWRYRIYYILVNNITTCMYYCISIDKSDGMKDWPIFVNERNRFFYKSIPIISEDSGLQI